MLNVVSAPLTSIKKNFVVNSSTEVENHKFNKGTQQFNKNSGFTNSVNSPPQPPTANPVIIIHQNNSISSNVVYLNTGNNNNNNINNNSMESSSSFSSSTSSTNSTEIDTNTDYSKDDLKYMKGYVNVLKERFTRRSLGVQAFEQFNNIYPNATEDTLTSNSENYANTLNNNGSNKAIRMSISDYQRRKVTTSGVNTNVSRLAASHNDYQRRRSASPFTNRESIPSYIPNPHPNFLPNYAIINPTRTNISNKYSSRDICSNLNESSKSMYTKKNSNIKRQFASSDDLSDLTNNNENTKSNNKNLPVVLSGQNSLISESSSVESTSQSIISTQPSEMSQSMHENCEKPDMNILTKPLINGHLSQVKNSSNSAYMKARRSCNNVDRILGPSDTLPSYSSMSQLNLNNENIIKCTYLNEINKDELPKPNFVSSVKNIFERQISSNQNSQSSLVSPQPQNEHFKTSPVLKTQNKVINEDSSNKTVIKNSPKSSNHKGKVQKPQSNNDISQIKNSPKNIKKNAPMVVLEPVCVSVGDGLGGSPGTPQSPEANIENLVDRMKHNGTLVYDHNNLINSQSTPTLITTQESKNTETLHISSKIETVETTNPKRAPPPPSLKPQNILLLTKVSPAVKLNKPALPPPTPKPTLQENTLQTLSFKERKDIFNKQNLIYSNSTSPNSKTYNSSKLPLKENTSSTSSPSPPNLPSHNKRQKMENFQKVENKENDIISEQNNIIMERNKMFNKMNLKLSTTTPENKEYSDKNRSNDTINLEKKQLINNNEKRDGLNYPPCNEKENDIFMQNSMPSATEILNSANEAQMKHKMNSIGQVKMKTFYGGEVIKDVSSLNLAVIEPGLKKASFRLNPTCPIQQEKFTKNLPKIEFIGDGVKLEKSNLSSSNFGSNSFSSFSNSNQFKSKNVNFRVNFKETDETFEYPSYEFLLKEMGIDPNTDPDYQIFPENISETLTFDSFLPGSGGGMSPSDSSNGTDYYDNQNLNFYSSNSDSENLNCFDETKFTKGSFTNFKPSWHNTNYELGSVENFNEILQPINQNTSSKTSPSHLNNKNTDPFITNDILPTKEEDLKRWSTDMDSNILF